MASHGPHQLVSVPLKKYFSLIMGGTYDLSLTEYGKGDGISDVFHNYVRIYLAFGFL